MTNKRIIFYSIAGTIIATLIGKILDFSRFSPAEGSTSAGGWVNSLIIPSLILWIIFAIYIWFSEKQETAGSKVKKVIIFILGSIVVGLLMLLLASSLASH